MTSHINNIEIILRAIIVYHNQILLCHSPENPPNYYYLPGGHLEKGEKLEDCLKREMKEEINVNIKKMKFLSISENFFTDFKGKHHEINILYAVQSNTKNPQSVKSHESHVAITWLDIKKLPKVKLLPPNIHQYLINHLLDKESKVTKHQKI